MATLGQIWPFVLLLFIAGIAAWLSPDLDREK
jgi:hypothetical protein